MITSVVQRWRAHRASYRHASETFLPSDYEVAEISGNGSDNTARAFVEAHHYSGSSPAMRLRFGLCERGSEIVGAVILSQPMHENVFRGVPGVGLERAELGRLVLLDRVKANAESWFVARCFELARRAGIVGVVSMSDPEPRTDMDGRRVFAGHIGVVYQASNAVYTGRTARRHQLLFPDGRVMSARTISKIRSKERGWEYGVRQLVAAGATEPGPGEDLRAWLTTALSLVTRSRRHPGQHRYVFGLDRRARRHLPATLPYPKFTAEVA